MSEAAENRFTLWAVLGIAALIGAAGFDGYHFISIAALLFALDGKAAA